MRKTSMPKERRRREPWWRSLEPFDVMVMVCAILVLPNIIVFCLLAIGIYALHFFGLL
jgi:hypothetical protein